MVFKLDLDETVRTFDKLCVNGLCSGLQKKDKKGNQLFCVEAAISVASGEHDPKDRPDNVDDHPLCVNHDIADDKIGINDAGIFRSNKERAKLLRNVAILQLGTSDIYDAHDKFRKCATDFLLAYFEDVFNYASISELKKHSELVKIIIDPDYRYNYEDEEGEDVYSVFLQALFKSKIHGYKHSKRDAYLLLIQAFEYALSKMNTPGYKWLVKNEKYKAPKLPKV